MSATVSAMLGKVEVGRLLECPKTMTNGPCGGVGIDGTCEVDHINLCVWWEALDGVRVEDQVWGLSPRRPPDWSSNGRWSDPFVAEPKVGAPVDHLLDKDARPVRTGSQFEHALRSGKFVVTCEINPPDSADAKVQLEQVRLLQGTFDAVHISDNSLASPHMCGLALAALIEQQGMETILHMTCRDRNRNMLQADLLGAAALGVKHVLCITGDHPAIGDHPDAKPVFDLDALSWIETVKQLRDEGTLMSGRALHHTPKLLIGGGAEPTSPPFEFRPNRLASKVAAGLDFAVTQVVYDMDRLRAYMRRVIDLGLDRKIHILVSVGALGGPAMARGMNNSTPGVMIPDEVIRRLESAPPGRRSEEGVKICVEQIEELLEMPGISGVDIMDVDPERYLELVEVSGLNKHPMAAGRAK